MDALPPRTASTPNPALIEGGDTVIVAAGSYRMGWTPGYFHRWGDPCAAEYAPACHLQPIPSGTAAQPTRILGAGWNSGCKQAPELWGTQGENTILDLDRSNHVEVMCLNLTDHSDCTLGYRPDPTFRCSHKATGTGDADPGLGDWAAEGLHAQDSNDVTLQDLDIHGFADMGVQAGRISDWNVTRVRVVGNGNAGWNGDLGGNNHDSSNSGALIFTDLTIAWNGCQENREKPGSYFNCYGQKEGGYGDGFGEAWTGGHFVFIRPVVEHNTQDGLDLLYANGTGSITVKQGHFGYNAGNDLKTSGPATITHSVFVGDCAVFKTLSMPAAADSCRAGGGELADVTGPRQTIVFAFNTVTTNGGCLFGGDPDDADASDVYRVSNNIFLGQSRWNGDGLTCLGWFGGMQQLATVDYHNNIIWNVRNGSCPAGNRCKNPKLKNQSLEHFNPEPLPGSPAIGAADGQNIGAIQ
jgi:hypothetical protein